METLVNTLKFVSGPTQEMYFSAWLSSVEDARRYDKCNFVVAKPLVIVEGATPLTVYMDEATATFLRSRNINYTWKPYVFMLNKSLVPPTYFLDNEPYEPGSLTDEQLAGRTVERRDRVFTDDELNGLDVVYRARIIGLVYDSTSGDATRITFPWLDFLSRYTAGVRQFKFEDEEVGAKRGGDSDSDDDDM